MASKKRPSKNAPISKEPRAAKQAPAIQPPPKDKKTPDAAPGIIPSNLCQAEDESDSELFPIVGIGASAGGLEAFTEFLENLPPDTGMGYVFVPHLDPKHVSLLTELLQRHTSMPVQDATNGVKVEPNHLYIIPRNTHMSLVGGVLTLSPRLESPAPHMPIDPFLRSLAADRKTKAIGVILSGNASDGALGMMAIKAAGGITFAQSSESAKFDSMPRAAIAAGCIDFVLPPKEIAQEIARLHEHPYIAPSYGEEPSSATMQGITRILSVLRNATGVDFTYYKPTTLRRRILRRMALLRVDNLDRYIVKLRSDPAEVNALYEDILINVTEFFRDPEAFEALKQIVFPKIVPPVGSAGPIRIWVPGCASGEEVYSIAMVLLEYLGDRANEVTIQLFGTDISEVALDKARSGVYSPSLVEAISPERLRRFFIKVDSSYAISKRIREMCIFAKQNLIKDPPFSKIDLISCRNVLIYLGPVLQKRIIPVFHYALKPNGYLFLGSSETIGASELFCLEDKKNKIYSRVSVAERVPIEFATEEPVVPQPSVRRPKDDWTEAEVAREADRIVLGKYSPAGVVIDNDFNIIQFRGRTSPYLEPPSGTANLNLIAMSREGLANDLRSALHRARRENVPVRRESLRVRRESGFAPVNIEVIPFKKAPGRENRFLVLFDEASRKAELAEKKLPKKRLSAAALERENNHLRQELIATKEYLQSVIEQHESANEELRSANEEIQSSNEELQSTNEELETAKEELQSTNEELNTLNEELQTRNMQLAQAGNDLLNLFSNVNIPIIMVGNDLRIRRFTPISQRLLNLIPTDVGRPISDINFNLQLPNLDRLLGGVMESLTPKTMNVKDLSGRPYSLRIRPYRTEDNKIDGAVIVLVDLDSDRAIAESMQPGDFSTATETLQSPRDAMRLFSAGLMAAQERERRNVALELHDDVTQRLALIELSLASLERNPPSPEELKHHLNTLHEQLGALSERMRQIAHQLHPSMLEDLGPVVAMEAYIRELNEKQPIQITFHRDNIPGNIDKETGLCLYRVVQESLHNVIKHSGAKSAQVTLKGVGNILKLSVADTGTGFDVEEARRKNGLGLRSMQERVSQLGGKFEILSQPGKGTEIDVTVPQREAAAQSAD